jgi:hypothetical protein
MEKFFVNVHTAQDLFKALQEIPEPVREILPIQIDPDVSPSEWEQATEISITAYEVRETEGCLETGFRISLPED